MAKLRLGSLSGLVPPSYRMKTVGPNGQAPSLVAMLRDFRPQQKLFLALGLMLVLMLSWWHFLSLDLPHMPDLSRSAHKAATDPASSLPGREAIQNATLGVSSSVLFESWYCDLDIRPYYPRQLLPLPCLTCSI